MGRRRLSVNVVKEALQRTNGNASAAAHLLGVSRSAVRHYIKTRPEVAEIVEEQQEMILDYCETGLLKAAMKGEPWAVRYGLSKMSGARDRGYGSGRQVEIAGGVRVDVAETDAEEVAAVVEEGCRAVSTVARYLESIGAGRASDVAEPLRISDGGDGAQG